VRWQIQPGWFNDEIKKSTHERDCFYKNRDFENYKRARNKTTSLFRKSKVNLFNKKYINYLWKHLKDINEQGPLSALPEVMQQDSQKVSDKKEIAIICNSHFAKISNMLNSKEDYINQFSTFNDSLNNKLGSNYFEI